ncbi:MAG: hypothetical protein QG632_719 [Candidatus Dependentiae bacterium]|nr:hypothetical protein [Candidatus Dependentiae bacterium]
MVIIERMGRARFSAVRVFEILKKLPQISLSALVQSFDFHPSTARDALEALTTAGILKEVTGKKRDRVYVYEQYLALLEEE